MKTIMVKSGVIFLFLILSFTFVKIAFAGNSVPRKIEKPININEIINVSDLSDDTRTNFAYSKLPLVFEENKGQTNSKVKYLARNSFYNLFLTKSESVLVLNSKERKTDFVKLKLIDSNKKTKINAHEKLPSISNYFIGNDPKKWINAVPTYGKVKCEQVYRGVDLTYYGNNGELEFDFELSPGANPSDIKLSFEGAKRINKDASGNIALRLSDGKGIIIKKPVVYQLVDSKKHFIDGSFVLGNQKTRIQDFISFFSRQTNYEVGFKVEEYDLSKTLVIDPVIIFSTFFGGEDFDEGIDLKVPSSSLSTYITGTTLSLSFPVTRGVVQQESAGRNDGDVFITHISGVLANSAILLSSTYLGGNDNDEARGIVIGSMNDIYIIGTTSSRNFPLLNAIQDSHGGGAADAFVTKLNSSLSRLIYSTYLGGSKIEEGNDIAIDSSDNVYVTGITNSENFPVQNALQPERGGFFGRDAFVAKLNSDGSKFIYSTYLGGSRLDTAFSIATDKESNAYVVGTTDSFNFPLFGSGNAAQFDAFVTKINPDGTSLLYSVQLGGGGDDEIHAIDLDDKGDIYVAGATDSKQLLVKNAFQSNYGGGKSDAFVAKINNQGPNVEYLTYLGGSGDLDSASAIVVDKKFGSVSVTGVTNSPDFPLVLPLQDTLKGDSDVFITKLDETGQKALFSTYLGGSQLERTRKTLNENEYKFEEIEKIIRYSGESDITFMGRLPLIPPVGGIDQNFLGNLVVTGSTLSLDYPRHNAFIESQVLKGSNVFVTEIGDIPRSSTCFADCITLCCKQGEICVENNPCGFDPHCTTPSTFKCIPSVSTTTGGPTSSSSSSSSSGGGVTTFEQSLNDLDIIQSDLRKASQNASPIASKIKFLVKIMKAAISKLSPEKCANVVKTAVNKLSNLINQLDSKRCSTSAIKKICIEDNIVDDFLKRLKTAFGNIEPLTLVDDNRNLTPDVCEKTN